MQKYGLLQKQSVDNAAADTKKHVVIDSHFESYGDLWTEYVSKQTENGGKWRCEVCTNWNNDDSNADLPVCKCCGNPQGTMESEQQDAEPSIVEQQDTEPSIVEMHYFNANGDVEEDASHLGDNVIITAGATHEEIVESFYAQAHVSQKKPVKELLDKEEYSEKMVLYRKLARKYKKGIGVPKLVFLKVSSWLHALGFVWSCTP